MMLAYLIKLIRKTFQTASSSAVLPLTLHLFAGKRGIEINVIARTV